MRPLSSSQRGQLCLLLSRTALKLHFPLPSLPLPINFFSFILDYLNSLVSTSKSTLPKQLVRQIYSGKLPIQREKRQESEGGRGKLLDMLFVDRLDRVLKALFYELEDKIDGNCVFCQELLHCLVLAADKPRYLSGEDLQQFRENVGRVVRLGEGSKGKLAGSVHSSHRMIDQYFQTHRQSSFALNRDDTRKLLSLFRPGKTAPKPPSIYDSIQSTRKQDVSVERKASSLRKNKRGSISSQCGSKRSSGLLRSQEPPARISSRWNSKYSVAEAVAHSLGKHRTARISNFQPLRARELSSSGRDEQPMAQRTPSIIEQETHPQTTENMGEGMRASRPGETLQFLEELRPFYIFLKEGRTMRMAVVKEINRIKESLVQKINFQLRVVGPFLPLQCTILIATANSSSREYYVQQQIGRQFELQRDLRGQLRATEGYGSGLKICQNKQISLLAIVRRISTYFIVLVRYARSEESNESTRKKKLLSGGFLSSPLLIATKLMNSDLSMCLQEEERRVVRSGGVVGLVQEEETGGEQGGEGHKLMVEHNSVREQGEAKVRLLWWGRAVKEQGEVGRKRKGRINAISKLHKFYLQKELEIKRLKRTAPSKNSLKLEADPHEDQLFKTYQARNHSRKELPHSEKKLPQQDKIAQAQRKRARKQLLHVETIRSDKGYKLKLTKVSPTIDGLQTSQYFGYMDPNPQNCAFSQTADPSCSETYLKSRLSIHCSSNKLLQSRSLVTFVKPLRTDEGFAGYLVSSIRLLTTQSNSCVFIDTYWERMQKYFIFIISPEVFQRLTDLNSANFADRPFSVEKKRGEKQRTSVVASLLRYRQHDCLKQSSSNRLKKMKHQEQEEEDVLFPRITFSQVQTVARGLKTMDTCSTSKNMKASQQTALRREVVSRLRNKFIKFASFVWRKHTLVLQLRNGSPIQIDASTYQEFEGSQVAVKCVYADPLRPERAAATELILVRYRESNLANLSCYNLEGLSKIYLEHLFIKNSSDLYGRYSSSIRITDIVDQSVSYRQNNRFFSCWEGGVLRSPILRNMASKTSSREDQRKYKYQEIVRFATQCCLPFAAVEKKRRRRVLRTLLVANRQRQERWSDLVVQIDIQDEEVKVQRLNGEVLELLGVDKIAAFFPCVGRLGLSKMRRILVQRVLPDGDLLRMCRIGHTKQANDRYDEA